MMNPLEDTVPLKERACGTGASHRLRMLRRAITMTVRIAPAPRYSPAPPAIVRDVLLSGLLAAALRTPPGRGSLGTLRATATLGGCFQFDPGRRVIARVRLAAHPPIHARAAQLSGRCLVEQQMIDTQAA